MSGEIRPKLCAQCGVMTLGRAQDYTLCQKCDINTKRGCLVVGVIGMVALSAIVWTLLFYY